MKTKHIRNKKAQTYLFPNQEELLKKRSQELGYPDIAKYIRKLIIEGMKHNYPYESN